MVYWTDNRDAWKSGAKVNFDFNDNTIQPDDCAGENS
jgi:hypothetical protein